MNLSQIPLATLGTVALVALAALTALRALRTSRTPQGAIGWVVFIFALPVLGIPLYLILGNSSYRTYMATRREIERVIPPRTELPEEAPRHRLSDFERLARVPAQRGCGVDLLIDGAESYLAMEEAVDAAQDYLLVQFYIIRNDAAGERLRDLLAARARDGVRVHVLYESFRGLGLPRGFRRILTEAGAQLHELRGPRRLLGRYQINYRNHRKLLVADGRVAFTGGFNIGEEYLGRGKLGAWRDTHARLTGPLVAQAQDIFVRDWFWAAGEDIGPSLRWTPPQDPRDMRALVLASGPTDYLPTGNLYFCALAHAARERLWLASPYCVPDTDVVSALKLAALRGVEVKLLVPDVADHILPWLAAFDYFDDMRHAGIEIWRYHEGFMHQKVALVDDDLASVGTINLDVRSGLLNFEMTALVADRGLAAEVEQMLEADFARAHLLTRELEDQPLWLRLAAPATSIFAPLL